MPKGQITKQVAAGVKLSLIIFHYRFDEGYQRKGYGMATLHSLPVPENGSNSKADIGCDGKIVALPFVRLETVLKTMKMLREFPDQSVLDQFNRKRHLS